MSGGDGSTTPTLPMKKMQFFNLFEIEWTNFQDQDLKRKLDPSPFREYKIVNVTKWL